MKKQKRRGRASARPRSSKPMGTCPHCESRVRAVVVEANTARRDALECPECHERVLICVTPGCKSYASGGELYDQNFCPECTATCVEAVTKTLKLGTDVAIKATAAALVAFVGGQFRGDD